MKKINEKELKEIFIEIKNNNKIIFEEFYNKYNKLIYGIAFSILKNKIDSEDIVQTVFTKIYSLEKEKLPTKKYASWLYSLTKNETISLLRKKNNYIELENIYELENENNEIDKIIEKEKFNKIISKLNDEEKEIISLKILTNLSFSEISKILDMPCGTVKWKYYKSLNTLKIIIANLTIFIITFILGLKNILIKNKEIDIPKQEQNNIEKNEQKNEEDETKKSQDTSQDNSRSEEKLKEEIKQEIIIPEEPQNNNKNQYFGTIMLIISAVFFIITIIFLIKYQLKSKNKTSK